MFFLHKRRHIIGFSGTEVVNLVFVSTESFDKSYQLFCFQGPQFIIAQHLVEWIFSTISGVVVERFVEDLALVDRGIVPGLNGTFYQVVQCFLIWLGIVDQRLDDVYSGFKVFIQAIKANVHLVFAGRNIKVDGKLVQFLVDLFVGFGGSTQVVEVVKGQG